MMDALTGDHALFIQDNIFAPLGLTQTFYRNDKTYPNYPMLVNSYWDRYSDGILENVSQMQRNNVSSLIGDDGIVATPTDAILFLKGLNEGKLLSSSTLEQMKTWVKDNKGNPKYGLGLGYGILHGAEAYGHSGGGIGAGCDLRYFPANGVYMFVAVNLGTVTESPIHKEAEKMLSEIQQILVK
jgi:D-alanyl-D-alanine carboxypeptidase